MCETIVKEQNAMSAKETSPAPTKDSVYRKAREVFGTPSKAHSWMTTENPIMGGMRPVDFIQYGIDEDLSLVLDELDRIDQGIF
jgi:uncharacterized protein (DUF2384 family)